MRKKLIRNDLFYLHYPYHGENDSEVCVVIAITLKYNVETCRNTEKNNNIS